jgi:hypothetical protein
VSEERQSRALTVKASLDAPLGFNFGKPKGLDSEKLITRLIFQSPTGLPSQKPPAVCRLPSVVKLGEDKFICQIKVKLNVYLLAN